ncbi:MAG: TIGR00730 family Rossman fold protein [Candidatus Uhrbacteria bacterium]
MNDKQIEKEIKKKIKKNIKHRLPEHPEEAELELNQMSDITWRIFRIMSEFVEGFQFLSEFKQEVTIFGSARFRSTNKWYKEARKLGAMLAKGGYMVITGGGPGIMEAANRGAYEVDPKKSIGINIMLPTEQRINKYVMHSKGFYYFFTRKVMMAASAQAYVFFPGGFGTCDEFFEMITLIQTGKAQKIPVVLMGAGFWEPMLEQIDCFIKEGTIKKEDRKLFAVCETAEEAMKYVRKSKERTIF